ncbi:MAG: hypothetical protein IME94_01220 [Proteobacteria bacterium]|nr:hypothetical protein [Pseudomonadota bacterium]
MTIVRRTFLLLLLAVFLVACKSAPILNINDAALNTDATMKLNDVTKSIIIAGNGLGWQMKKVKPGEINATLYLRDHVARVKVKYTTTNYSINYVDSTNLDYKASDPNHDGQAVIHSNYNGWIQNLSNAINNQVYSL